MGKTKGPYKEEFPKHPTVQIAGSAFLASFLKTWKLHHKLEPLQLNYANKIAKLKSLGFYHGADGDLRPSDGGMSKAVRQKRRATGSQPFAPEAARGMPSASS